jgi:hypothetical protein
MQVTELQSEIYLLVISGSIQFAPFLTSWKTLKDDIRRNVGDPGHTRVSSIVQREIRRGWCNFTQENNARAAYRMSVYTNDEEAFFDAT